MKNYRGQRGFGLISVVIAIAIVALAAYGVGSWKGQLGQYKQVENKAINDLREINDNLKKNNQAIQNNSNQNESTKSDQIVDNWQLFSNSQYQYTIKYPQQFSVKEWADVIKAGAPRVNNWLLSEVAFGNNSKLGDWQISINVSARDIIQEKEIAEISINAKGKEIIIDGVKAIKYEGSAGEGLSGKIISILVPYENKVYNLVYSETSDKTDNIEIFYQMISTFRFTK